MKILLITEKVDKNDEVFGYFHGRILDLVPHCEKLTILCLEENQHNIPNSVKILSLGKEKNQSRFRYIFNFYRFILSERKNYDTVFVHMAPIWIVMGGLIWRLLGKKIVLWYSHKFVDWKLRVAEFFATLVLTPSENSFRIRSKKVRLTHDSLDLEALLDISRKG